MLNIKITRLTLGVIAVSIIVLLGVPISFCADKYDLANLINNVSENENSFCTETDCFFPKKGPVDEDIYIEEHINWDKDKNLVIHTKGNIIFKKNGKIISLRNGSVVLKAGMMPGEKDIYDATVKLDENDDPIEIIGEGKIKIYYNPTKGEEEYKYYNPTIYSDVFPSSKLETYMLVNDVHDLQGMTACLYGTYALSQDIDASSTREWNNGQGFTPIKNVENGAPFSGVFDGNNHIIKKLYINRPEENNIGLFGDVTGVNEYRSLLKDFIVEDSFVRGKRCVGVVMGQATGVKIDNVKVTNSGYAGTYSGKVAGCVLVNEHKQISADNTVEFDENNKPKKEDGKLFGSCVHCKESDGDNKVISDNNENKKASDSLSLDENRVMSASNMHTKKKHEKENSEI